MKTTDDEQLTWDLRWEGRTAWVVLQGAVTEQSRTKELAETIKDAAEIVLDTAGVTRFNSLGVSRWKALLGHLSDRPVRLRRCSSAVVSQMNMIWGLAHGCEVESVFASYVCEETGEYRDFLLELADVAPDQTPVPRVHEGKTYEFDDTAERYLAFREDIEGPENGSQTTKSVAQSR